MINVAFVFTMQLILLLGVYYQLTTEDSGEGGSITFTMMHFDVVLTRLVCAVLMHLQSEPEVRQAMAMFKYVLNHSKVKTSAAELHKSMVDYCDRKRQEYNERKSSGDEKRKLNESEEQILQYLEENKWTHSMNPTKEGIAEYFVQMKNFQTNYLKY